MTVITSSVVVGVLTGVGPGGIATGSIGVATGCVAGVMAGCVTD